MIGLMIMGFGIALMVHADLGGAPWDVLHIGLTNQFGLTVGTWSILMGFVVLTITTVLMKSLPQIGAFLNMIFLGIFIDLFLWIIPAPEFLVLQYVMMIAGIVIIGYGIGVYIAPGCGAGPRDSLMLALQLKTGWKVQHVRVLMEVSVLTVGWLLGGTVFIGTLIFCFGIGSIVGITLPHCKRLFDSIIERGNKDEDFNERPLRTYNHDGIS
ncbi:YitT family protein [Alkalihalobacillus sp. MEB130]|uniref:YczE/YyaS/YitT family protein n=1 Tax=Alkalihalobacillus sp. MEB130 TaxID=2976704 RepID=UPI0028DDCE29|nr:YitT family protein [Alkalihalobacillus sp. MEB130]MDT8861521.1 YitT family protein [Alkalihalobacillus sp. MEB130]